MLVFALVVAIVFIARPGVRAAAPAKEAEAAGVEATARMVTGWWPDVGCHLKQG